MSLNYSVPTDKNAKIVTVWNVKNDAKFHLEIEEMKVIVNDDGLFELFIKFTEKYFRDYGIVQEYDKSNKSYRDGDPKYIYRMILHTKPYKDFQKKDIEPCLMEVVLSEYFQTHPMMTEIENTSFYGTIRWLNDDYIKSLNYGVSIETNKSVYANLLSGLTYKPMSEEMKSLDVTTISKTKAQSNREESYKGRCSWLLAQLSDNASDFNQVINRLEMIKRDQPGRYVILMEILDYLVGTR